jgi:SWI/SNF-related matrix-associated actin-dependent regulator 1 of chromatin subfamily A
METIQISELVDWGDAVRVPTKFGDKMLRKAAATEEFWEVWKENSPKLKDAGVSVGKNYRTNAWEVCWWLPLPQDVVETENAAKAASRAIDADVNIPVPEGLSYLPFQRAGIAFASTRQNVLIGDEMGLGKTIQAIGCINADDSVKKVLVVCPASLKLNWKREMETWLVRKFLIGISKSDYFPSSDIVIINYDILKKHAANIAQHDWDLIIADECHYAKNAKAQRSQALYAIPARRKVFLTGTPITNRPVELQPIAAALDTETFGNFFKFAKRYCNAHQKSAGKRMVWDFTGSSHLDELQDKLRRTIMVRRLKSEVLTELPPKRRQVVELEVPKSLEHLIQSERELFDSWEEEKARLKAEVELAKTESRSAYENAVERLTEAQKIAFTELSKVRHELAVAKVPQVLEHVNEVLADNEGYKVVLFAHHKDVVSALMAEFGERAVAVVGDTAMEARQAAVDSFQNDPKIQVFVGSIRAAGVGLTLTSSSHVIFAELDWTPANMSQAEDRCHRIGQVNSVLVQHLVFDGSLDVKFAKTLVRKQSVIDKALDNEIKETVGGEIIDEIEISTKELTPEEIERKAIEESVSEERKVLALMKIRYLAGVCNYAQTRDGQGFNGADTAFGHRLAALPKFSAKQTILAENMIQKYRRQLSAVSDEVLLQEMEVAA